MRGVHINHHSKIGNQIDRSGNAANSLFGWLIIAAIFTLIFTAGGQQQPRDNKQATATQRQIIWLAGDESSPVVDNMNPMLPRLVMAESSGNCDAVSKRGARGCTQVMPHTARRPGYGVEPMRDNSIEEQMRFGNQYLNAMQKKFGSPVLAAAAYNAGPAAVERALQKAKGDHKRALRHLPAETQNYVVKVAYDQPQQIAYNSIPNHIWEGK